MHTEDATVLFIHGLGETPGAWDAQIAELPSGFTGVAVDVFGPGATPDDDFSFRRVVGHLDRELDRRGLRQAHLCGLSLGAMIALQFALDRPERVRSLTLAAGQVKPPKVLMRIQRAVMSALPERVVAAQGVSKPRMLAALREAGRADFSDRLSSVSAPTLVLCGSRDRPNLPASRALAEGVPRARLRILDGAGHQSHTQTPQPFADALRDFLLSLD